MATQIDFTKGGYQGDAVETAFQGFTKTLMPWWWHFREVLRAVDVAPLYLHRLDGRLPTDDEYKEFVALSLLHYAVCTGTCEALAFLHEAQCEVARPASPLRVFEVRRGWKALYSSLYSSLNALANTVCVVVGLESPFGTKLGLVRNYTPTNALRLARDKGLNQMASALAGCEKRLEIRHHLDHYWTIWVEIGYNSFRMDKAFKKGYVVVDPAKQVKLTVNALLRARNDILGCAKHFNVVYEQLSVTGGLLDQYLQQRGWTIDYSDYGPPHDGKRPVP
jgi:hypothetical protein